VSPAARLGNSERLILEKAVQTYLTSGQTVQGLQLRRDYKHLLMEERQRLVRQLVPVWLVEERDGFYPTLRGLLESSMNGRIGASCEAWLNALRQLEGTASQQFRSFTFADLTRMGVFDSTERIPFALVLSRQFGLGEAGTSSSTGGRASASWGVSEDLEDLLDIDTFEGLLRYRQRHPALTAPEVRLGRVREEFLGRLSKLQEFGVALGALRAGRASQTEQNTIADLKMEVSTIATFMGFDPEVKVQFVNRAAPFELDVFKNLHIDVCTAEGLRMSEAASMMLDRVRATVERQLKRLSVFAPADASGPTMEQGMTTKVTALGMEPGATEGPKATETKTETRSILFLDVTGWSKLSADDINRYVTAGMPKIAALIKNSSFLNTWGDAIVATFGSAKDAAESALEIRDFFKKGYPADGIKAGLSCRISLHVGEVMICDNAILGRKDIFGQAVHVAARLEPATRRGHVFCTKAFADRLKEVEGLAPKPWSLGVRQLAKNFGSEEVFVVTWANDDDPTPGIPPEEPPAAKPAGPAVADSTDTILLRLKEWLNVNSEDASKRSIPFSDVDEKMNLPAGAASEHLETMLANARSERGSGYKIDHRSATEFMLKYERARDSGMGGGGWGQRGF
jgi:class 3 adenylate cyclase